MAAAETDRLQENVALPDLPSPTRPPEPSWDSVAGKLLRERFLLTALELYLELEERGKDLPVLKEYFSNPVHFEAKTAAEPHSQAGPGMFRTSSQTTLDSLDWGRLSEDGERAGDERVAVLEFELRKARETIQGLRATLTQATEQRLATTTTTTTLTTTTTNTTTTTTPPSAGAAGQGGAGRGERSAPAPPPPHERRTLNFLINEYLASASYKLTAITFADENDDQDFEHWDDVGLNTSRPPSLVQLLRESGGGGGGDDRHHHLTTTTTTTAAAGTQTEEEVVVLAEVEELREVVMQQERELEKLHHRLSSPIAPPSPCPAPDRTQGEGRPATTLSPGASASQVETGRESPEGTSDSEGGATGASGSVGASGFVMVPSPTSPEEDLEECPALPDSIEDLLAGADDPLKIAPPQDSISDQITEILDDGAGEGVPRGVSGIGESVEEEVTPENPRPAPAPEVEGPSGAGQHLEFLVSEAKKLLSGSSMRKAPPGLEDRVLRAGLMCAAGQGGARVVEALAGWGGTDLAGVVARTLPLIAPNVILAKREEVVPLVVAGAGQQECAGQREALLGLLFSLMKRPDEEQRAALLGGLGVLARVLGPPRLETELLPRVWDDLAHRRPERRLLVAGAVAALAPHTPAPLRNSLLLSMLLQLLAGGPTGERDPQVREAALTSLALLATFMDDTDKLPQLTTVLTQTLACPGPSPHQPAAPQPSPGLELLARALLSWGLEAGRLAAVVDPLLDLLAGQVAGAGQGGAGQGGVAVACTVRLVAGAVLPVLLASLVTSMPGATPGDDPADTQAPPAPALPPPLPCPALEGLQEVLGEGWGGAEASLALLHTHLAKEWLPPWPALDYLTGRVLPGLLEALAGLQAWPGPSLDAFLVLFSQLPQCLGPALTTSTLAPLFLARLDGADPEAVRRGATGLTGPVAVAYTVAILGQGGADVAELEGFLARQISILGLCGAPLAAPLLTVASLMATPRQAEAVLAALWASVVHRSPAVRCAAAGLWGAAVAGAEDGALGPRVVPALVTLAADPNPRVKAATLTPLATALTAATTPEVVDKVWLQLETLADDPSLVDQLDYHLSLAHTTTHLAHTGHARLIHHFLLPRMCRLAVDGAVGAQLGAALLEAYSALTCCNLPDHVIVHFIIPPLQQLQKTLGPTSFDHMETITDLLREYTLHAQASISIDRRKSSTLSLGGGLPTAANVEEVKTKVSKMFSAASRPSVPINASLPAFLKKK